MKFSSAVRHASCLGHNGISSQLRALVVCCLDDGRITTVSLDEALRYSSSHSTFDIQ